MGCSTMDLRSEKPKYLGHFLCGRLMVTIKLDLKTLWIWNPC